jgi:hypothetical protein
VCSGTLGVTTDAPEPNITSDSLGEDALKSAVRFWHQIALDAHVRDYSRPDQTIEQPGPCFTSRAFAMLHIAIYDAVAGATREGETYYEYCSLPTFNNGANSSRLAFRSNLFERALPGVEMM